MPDEGANGVTLTSGEGTPPPAEITRESTITVDGKEVNVGELMDSQAKTDELQNYRQHASVLIRGFEGTPTDEQIQSVRHVMGAEGYEEETINDYVASLHGREAAPQQQQQEPAQTEGTFTSNENTHVTNLPTSSDPNLQAMYDRVQKLEQQNAEADQRLTETRAERLQEQLERAVTGALDNEEAVQVLLKQMDRLQGLEGSQARRDRLKEDIDREVMSALRARHNANQRVDADQFPGDASKATKLVVDRLRAVIGDPDVLQRAPETAPGEMTLRPSEPVDFSKVKWEPGDDAARSQDKARQLTIAALSEIASDVDQGGTSRV